MHHPRHFSRSTANPLDDIGVRQQNDPPSIPPWYLPPVKKPTLNRSSTLGRTLVRCSFVSSSCAGLGTSLFAAVCLLVTSAQPIAAADAPRKAESAKAKTAKAISDQPVASKAAANKAASDRQQAEAAKKTAHAEDVKFWKEKLKPFFQKHCVDCHSGESAEAGVDLAAVDENTDIMKQRPRWNQIRGLIEIGAMPPPDHDPLPSMEQREEIADWIDRRINSVDCNVVHDPGRVTLRRLNNKEYDNTARDLFGIDFSPTSIVAFPSDGIGNGFDNQGDVLTLSPLQLEKYFQAASLIAERIIVTDRETLRRQRGDGGQMLLNDRISAKFLFADGKYELSSRMEFGDNKEENASVKLLVDGEVVETFEVGSERQKYEKDVDFKAGWHEIAFHFVKDSDGEKADYRRRVEVEYVGINGPRDGKPALPEPHERLFVAEPGDDVTVEQAAEKIFAPLLRRAFRRQPTPLEVSRVVNLVKLASDEGESFESAVGIGLQSVLVSPHFLFRIESEPSKTRSASESLSDNALASRLSYFLWASAPDEQLLDAADAGQLHTPQQLEAAAKRMLADPRSQSLVSEFFMQALDINRLREVEPDKERFPLWNDRLRDAMKRETELVCQEILKQDRSMLDLLVADFTFINPRLAEFYGMEFDGESAEELYRQGRGNSFRRGQDPKRRDGQYARESEWLRVDLPENRQGVLTHASVLTLTSNPRDTSPVKRGKWILENILGDPPPAAPPNVPSFDDTKNKHQNLTLRKQLEIHRENPSCASCHRVMDPLGLGFENFDPTGRWRDKDRDQPIDASGQLTTGEKFSGAKELLAALTKRESQIAKHFVSKLLTYALGRGLEPYDNCTVDLILARAEKDDYRMSTIIAAIVSSEPFRLRRGIQENPL